MKKKTDALRYTCLGKGRATRANAKVFWLFFPRESRCFHSFPYFSYRDCAAVAIQGPVRVRAECAALACCLIVLSFSLECVLFRYVLPVMGLAARAFSRRLPNSPARDGSERHSS